MVINSYLEVIIAAIIWGSAGVFVKYLNLPPATISFFRLAVPTVILLAFFAWRKIPLFKGDNRLILFGSLLNVVKTFFYFLGLTLASIGNAIIVYFIWPILTVILGALVLREKTAKRSMFLFGIAFLGIILVYLDKKFSFSDRDFVGMTAMMVSALATAAFMVTFKKVAAKYSKFEMIFYQNVAGAVAFLPFLFIDSPRPEVKQLAVVTVYALLVGVVGFVLYFSALKKIKVSTASFLSYFEPVSAIIFAALLLGEKLTWNMIAGGLLIIASTMMLKTEKTKKDLQLPIE